MDGESLSIPNFDRHMSQSAKARGVTAKRVARHKRKGNANANANANGSVTVEALPEKRREEKRIDITNTPLPPLLDNDGFKAALAGWLRYKSERGHSYKPSGLSAVITRAANIAAERGLPCVIEAMQRAAANGWAGWDHVCSNDKPKTQVRRNIADDL
jgi:hypothetical protein